MYDVTFADKELEIKLQEINSLEMMLREATINEQALTIRIGESKKRMESLPDIVQASQTVQARRGKEIQLMQRELDITLQRYTKENPKVKEMMLKLEQLKKIDAEQGDEPILPDTQTYSANMIKQAVETELANMESERLALLCKIENYNNQIEMAKLELAKLTSMQEGYLDAKHNLNVARELFKMIDQRIVEARMAMDATAYDIDFLERAEPALQPESTGRKILAVLSTFGMAFIGVAFVLAYAIFSPGVKVPGDLDSMDAVEFIGVLPRKKNSTLTTYFSTLQIVVNRIDSRLSEVGPTMVTFASVKSGEGKTTIMDDITDMKSVTGKKILILKRVLEPDVNRSIQVPTNSIINFQDFREENMNVPEPVKINDKTSRLYYIVGNNISKLNILPEVVVNFKNKYSEFDYIFIELFSPKRNYQVSGCIMQSAHYNILVTKYGANTVSAIDKITKLAVSSSTNKVGTVINFGDLNLS